MNKKFTSTIISSLIIVFVLTNCSQEPDYDKMVRDGVNSGIENNELFLEYELGMTRDDFYAVSWEMNKEKIITGLVKIEYEFDELKSTALMRFYPEFKNDKISKIPIDIQYVAWAPWNHNLSSDSLVVDLKEYYEEKNDADFKDVYVPSIKKNALVSVKGNQAILIYPLSDVFARLEFIDLNTLERN